MNRGMCILRSKFIFNEYTNIGNDDLSRIIQNIFYYKVNIWAYILQCRRHFSYIVGLTLERFLALTILLITIYIGQSSFLSQDLNFLDLPAERGCLFIQSQRSIKTKVLSIQNIKRSITDQVSVSSKSVRADCKSGGENAPAHTHRGMKCIFVFGLKIVLWLTRKLPICP
jgi:hypothetical protein